MERIAVVDGCVLTMNADRVVHAAGTVLIENGRIAEVRASRGKLPVDATIIDARGCAVLPGLVNAHSHLYASFGRSLSFDQEFVDWLRTQKSLIAQLDEEDFALCIESGLVLNLRSGNTCVVDNLALPGAWGNKPYRAALQTAARYHVSYLLARGYTDQLNSPEYVEDLATIERLVRELVGEFHKSSDGRLRVMLSPMLPWALSMDGFRMTRRMADELGLGIHMHTAETAGYADMIEKAFGHRSNVKVYQDGGCLGPDVQLLGCSHLTDEELDTVAKTGTRVILDPISGTNLGLGRPPTLKAAASSSPTALATNGMASAGGQDMFQAMRYMVGLARLDGGGPDAMSVQRALDMATIEGARALQLESEIGSLEPGKRADVICVDLATAYATPALNVPASLVFTASSRDVRDVVANGRLAVRERKLLLGDEAALVEHSRARARAALDRAGMASVALPRAA